jgi:Flp pilus assembly protein TadB
MNATTQFPWAMVVSNAVWICGLAVILAALGWHDYKRRERASNIDAGFSLRQDQRNLKVAAPPRDKRSLKAAATTEAEPLMKPILLGLIMIAGGAALSIGSPWLAAIFAIAATGLIALFVKRFFLGRTKSTINDEERRRRDQRPDPLKERS